MNQSNTNHHESSGESSGQVGQQALQILLRERFGEFRLKNPQFSMRAFAKRVGLQPSAMNEILKGQRRVSLKMAERISSRLLLAIPDRQRLLKTMALDALRSSSKRSALSGTVTASLKVPEKIRSELLTADQCEILEDWVHFAILSLIRNKGFKSDVASMSNRLGVPLRRIRTSLARLERLGLIHRDQLGRLKRTKGKFHTTEDILNQSIQRAHLGDLELAKEALLQVPVELRDFSSLTLPVSPRLLSQAKAILRQAQDDVEALLESEATTEVYRLSMQLFPLTQINQRASGRTHLKNSKSRSNKNEK